MSLVVCKECKQEVSTEASACPNCGAALAKAGAPKLVDSFSLKRTLGWKEGLMLLIVGLGTIAWMAHMNQPTPAQSSAPSTSQESGSRAPIDKNSEKELAIVSEFISEMMDHYRRMDAIEDKLAETLAAVPRDGNIEVVYKSIANYTSDVADENEKISGMEVPNIENQEAGKALRYGLEALRSSSNIQKEVAFAKSKLTEPHPDIKQIGPRVKELVDRQKASSINFAIAFSAYQDYGYSSKMIDWKTGRLKPDAVPDSKP